MNVKQSFFQFSGGALLILATIGCSKNTSVSDASKTTPQFGGTMNSLNSAGVTPLSFGTGTTVFQSGFEPGTNNPDPVRIVNVNALSDDILGNSGTGPGVYSSSWVYNLETHATSHGVNNISSDMRLNYNAAHAGQSNAELTTDPQNSSNPVLRFWINTPAESDQFGPKGRVQAEFRNLDGPTGVTSYYQEISMYLPSAAYNNLKASIYPANYDWLSLMEFHDKNPNVSTNHNYDYRMTIGLDKVNSVTKKDLSRDLNKNKNLALKFVVTSDTWPTNAPVQLDNWRDFDDAGVFEIPFDTWIETQLYIKEGDNSTGANGGRFYFAARVKGTTTWKVIFDIHNWTRDPANTMPTGQTDWSPMKLYGNANVINAFHPGSNMMQVYWDNVKVFKNKNPL